MQVLKMQPSKSPWTPNARFEQSRFVVNRLDHMALKSMKINQSFNEDKLDGPSSLPCFINQEDMNRTSFQQNGCRRTQSRTTEKGILEVNIIPNNAASASANEREAIVCAKKNKINFGRVNELSNFYSEGPASLPTVTSKDHQNKEKVMEYLQSCDPMIGREIKFPAKEKVLTENFLPLQSIGSFSYDGLNHDDFGFNSYFSYRSGNLADIEEIDRISITNSQLAEEREICFNDEICQDLEEFPEPAKAGFSEEGSFVKKDDLSCAPPPSVHFDPNNKRNESTLLEEIEADLAKKYSFKKTLASLYSVGMYRTYMRLSRVIGRIDGVDTELEENKELENSQLNKKKTDDLKKELLFQKMLVDQAAKIINLKKCDQSEKLKAIKACVLSSLSYKAVKCEIERLERAQNFFEMHELQSGFAIIQNINVFVEKPETMSPYFFILAAVERDNVKMTEIKEMCGDNVGFQDILQFQNLRQDFIIKLFLYGISIKEKTKQNFYHMSAERLHLIHKKKGGRKMLNVVSAEHSIIQLGSGQIHKFNMQNAQWFIKSKSQHLKRNITIRFEGDINLEAQHTGFLDIKYLGEKIPNKFTLWSRFWFQLAGADLKGWHYPSDHTFKDASRIISIEKCLTKGAKPMSRSTCVRPNVFTFFVKQDEGNGHQVLCAADTAEDMKLWCYQINQVIQHYRKCHSS